MRSGGLGDYTNSDAEFDHPKLKVQAVAQVAKKD